MQQSPWQPRSPEPRRCAPFPSGNMPRAGTHPTRAGSWQAWKSVPLPVRRTPSARELPGLSTTRPAKASPTAGGRLGDNRLLQSEPRATRVCCHASLPCIAAMHRCHASLPCIAMSAVGTPCYMSPQPCFATMHPCHSSLRPPSVRTGQSRTPAPVCAGPNMHLACMHAH
jgi:hypothetical protein